MKIMGGLGMVGWLVVRDFWSNFWLVVFGLFVGDAVQTLRGVGERGGERERVDKHNQTKEGRE